MSKSISFTSANQNPSPLSLRAAAAFDGIGEIVMAYDLSVGVWDEDLVRTFESVRERLAVALFGGGAGPAALAVA
ncbi:hypothetical protein [Limnoglobus roseus]|uniref:Uncharacterized protein n=1 Tax=Limnoglobus roseus TaxID=2598579 RepID=A0A5C1ACM8_9BACT|nr:hypothetical protein [Limnoglobus roseus]QEL17159.1 hypothetical protein PX52LOC_04141 [Limnoglobus roseus]